MQLTNRSFTKAVKSPSIENQIRKYALLNSQNNKVLHIKNNLQVTSTIHLGQVKREH